MDDLVDSVVVDLPGRVPLNAISLKRLQPLGSVKHFHVIHRDPQKRAAIPLRETLYETIEPFLVLGRDRKSNSD